MRRRAFLAGLAASPLAASAQTFEEFRERRRQGDDRRRQAFQDYEERVRAAFEAFRQAHQRAYAAYRERIAARWPDPRLPSQTRWVEYREDLAVRRTANFRDQRLRIEIRHPRGQAVEDRLLAHLRGLLEESPAQALQRDPVARSVEKAAREHGEVAATGQPDRRPLASGAWGDGGSEAGARQRAETLYQRGKVETVPVRAARGSDAERTVLSVDLPEGEALKDYRDYVGPVRRLAGEWGVSPALTLAIMHTESSFNPMAKSHIPAYGLMQIVPESAGRDASRRIFGRPRLLTPSYLYNAENNINVGCCYLSLLDGEYLAAVEEPESRLYCVIAAYNTGPGNVARAFNEDGSVARAAQAANRLSPQAVYRRLRRQLPYAEARQYLKRVSRRLPAYRDKV
jgi:membrane-bound lytic murein transglycosylase C